jgi:O-antigen ligase
VSLSFGEFGAIVLPIGIYYAVYGDKFSGRTSGVFLILICLAGVFCSGARGAYFSVASSSCMFVALWFVRSRKFNPGALAPAFVGVAFALACCLIVVLVIFWPRAHNFVLGGGETVSSTDARFQQWEMAKPYLWANPITGHGFGLGGEIIDNGSQGAGFTIDSYVLSLLVETGVPGLVFFIIILGSAIWYSAKRSLIDPSKDGALNGALSSVVVAFATYRLVLSQRENHTLLFVILGLIMVSQEIYGRSHRLENLARLNGRRSIVKKTPLPRAAHTAASP